MLVSRRVIFFVCLFPFCSDVPIKMEGLITMQFQIWVCHRGCLQFNTWVWNPKELFVNRCLMKQPFSIQRFGIIQLKQPFKNGWPWGPRGGYIVKP